MLARLVADALNDDNALRRAAKRGTAPMAAGLRRDQSRPYRRIGVEAELEGVGRRVEGDTVHGRRAAQLALLRRLKHRHHQRDLLLFGFGLVMAVTCTVTAVAMLDRSERHARPCVRAEVILSVPGGFYHIIVKLALSATHARSALTGAVARPTSTRQTCSVQCVLNERGGCRPALLVPLAGVSDPP